MANNLVNVIFNQFLGIVEKISKKACFEFDECDFDYRVRELAGHRLIDVIYVVEDKCGRRHDVVATIDFTNICFEDLTNSEWKTYLNRLAVEFVNNICPKKYEIPLDEKRKCRPQPPAWTPLPCNNITTVIHKRKIVTPEPECEVIIENECECVPLCKRKTCSEPKHTYVVKYITEKPWKCGDVTSVVKDPIEKLHDFHELNGNPDYNNHKWRSCCGGSDISLDVHH